MKLIAKLKLFAILLTISVLAVLAPVQAAVTMPLTSDDPVNYTPRIIGTWAGGGNYRTVIDLAKVDNMIYAGGVIDKVAKPDGTQLSTTFGNIIRFNSNTGEVDESFNPILKGVDGDLIAGIVYALEAAPDGKSLFIGGEFKTVDGFARKGLIKWDLVNNRLDQDFDARVGADGGPGIVYDLKFVRDQLLVGSNATSIGGANRTALASLNPNTGAATNYSTVNIEGIITETSGPTRVYKIAVSPDATRAVIIGAFRKIESKERLQLAMLNLGSDSLELSDWYARDVMRITTPPQEGPPTEESCGASAAFCLRDVDWAPNGQWFAIAATGGPGMYYPTIKDAISRFENNDKSNNYPTWINYSKSDTFHSVRVTGKHVYTGGHNKWLNGSVYYKGEKQTVTIEEHYGLGVIVAATGRAVTNWNLGTSTSRGEGWRGMLVVPGQGLWVGGDGDFIKGEQRNRLGLMPVEQL